MTSTDSLRAIVERVVVELQNEPITVTGQATLDDLDLDSLAIVELLDNLSRELGRPLEDDLFNKTMTVDELVAILEEQSRRDN
jgi:acyl carrier protein